MYDSKHDQRMISHMISAIKSRDHHIDIQIWIEISEEIAGQPEDACVCRAEFGGGDKGIEQAGDVFFVMSHDFLIMYIYYFATNKSQKGNKKAGLFPLK